MTDAAGAPPRRSSAVAWATTALLVSVILLVLAATAMLAGGRSRADGRERREQARENLAAQRKQTDEGGAEVDTSIANAGDLVALAQESLDLSLALAAVDGQSLEVDRQLRDAGAAGDVDRYNTLIGQSNGLADEHNARVDELNQLAPQLEAAAARI